MKIESRAPRTEMIRARVEPNLKRKAEVAAAAAGVTLSDLIRAGVEEATRNVLGRVAETPEEQ